MSLTELVLVVGLWAVWLGVLMLLLHALGREERRPVHPSSPRPRGAPSP